MEFGYGFTDLWLTPHAGLPAFAQVLKPARLPGLFGPSLKTIPGSAIFTAQVAMLAVGKPGFEDVSAYRNDPAFVPLRGLKGLPSADGFARDSINRPPIGSVADCARRLSYALGSTASFDEPMIETFGAVQTSRTELHGISP